MQRREFSQWALAGAGASALGAFGSPAFAQVTGLKEGTDYLTLKRAVAVDSAAGQVEVLEFFAYTCIHCYNLEPHVAAWEAKKPAHVVLRRTPVAFAPAMEPLQRLYYALEAMGKVKELHEKVFRAVHVEKQRLTSAESVADWVAKQGVDKTKFNQFYNAFGVVGKTRRASQLVDAYQVEGTPALGVAGKYYVSGQGPRTFEVANALIAHLKKS